MKSISQILEVGLVQITPLWFEGERALAKVKRLINRRPGLFDSSFIHHQAVVSKIMPIGNLTGMTESERKLLGDWYHQSLGTKGE